MSHYDVGGRDVVVWERRNRWWAAIDRIPVPGWFPTEAEAWAAGVREAYRVGARPSPRALQGAP